MRNVLLGPTNHVTLALFFDGPAVGAMRAGNNRVGRFDSCKH